MAALLNVKQFVRFDEHGNLNVPNKLFVACQAYVQTPMLGDNSNRVATTEWVRAQLTNVTGISLSETDPIWASDKTYYYTKLQSDARYLQSFTETDPTVPAWAKASVKPTYTFAELLSKPTTIAGYGITDIPTTLPASDVYAWAKAATKPSYTYSEITGLPTIPTNNNQLTNGAGYLTSYTETDPIWVSEKGNYALKTYVDTSISNLVASAPATLNTLNELALALGSDANFATTVSTSIGNRVPYTGATGNVNLGAYKITTSSPFIDNVTAGGSLNFKMYDASDDHALNNNNYFSFYPLAGYYAIFSFNNAGVRKRFLFHTGNLAADTPRYYGMPNADGTLALTSDIPSLANYVTLNGGQTISGAKTFTGSVIVNNSAEFSNGGLVVFNGNALVTKGIAFSDTGSPAIFGDAQGFSVQRSGTTSTINVRRDNVGGANSFTQTLAFSNNAANRTYTFPDASGTVALTSSLSSYVPATRTITINGTALDLSADRAWTITAGSTYTLPTASATVLGGIKVGSNLSIDVNGVLSSTDTNTTYSVFTGATALANGTAGLVVAPLIANRAQYLKGDGTWGTPPDTDTTYVAFTRSAAGLTPAPGGTTGTTKYLREDGTWAVPPDTDTDTNTVTSIRREDADGTTGATTYRTGDIRLRQGANVTISEISAGIFQIASSYTDTNTWNANTKTADGYVTAPGAVANKVWKTDASGNPGWRDDADTDTNTTYTAGTGLTLTGTVFSVTKTITASETADTIALRNGSGQLVATGFYQTSSRSLKTNISPFTKSALDIIRDVTVVSFNYKTDIINKHVGFIAEDTPEELSTRNKNVMDSNNTIGVLLKAVQELEARIKQLESK
jgi:hypothetical protein